VYSMTSPPGSYKFNSEMALLSGIATFCGRSSLPVYIALTQPMIVPGIDQRLVVRAKLLAIQAQIHSFMRSSQFKSVLSTYGT